MRPLDVLGVAHVGYRVLDEARSIAFYEKLGFAVAYRSTAHRVVILRNAAGVEINLIVNAEASRDGTNVLMDVPEKLAGITHVAFAVSSMEDVVRALGEQGIPITEGPVKLGDGHSLFVRDPDRNVIELRVDAR